jgi:glycosyltransferase involved in cell wall biosynthesis
MRLVVVSHTPHHLTPGGPAGWAATVRELDQIASLFDEVVHIAPVHRGPTSDAMNTYAATNIRLVPVTPAGGNGSRAKAGLPRAALRWAMTIRRELRGADVVHVRAPANIAAVALVVLAARRQPSVRWHKYAGDWQPGGAVPTSFAVQRWWLRRAPRLHRGTVTVSARLPDDGPHVVEVFNPAFTAERLADARARRVEHVYAAPLRLVFVGRLEPAKGVTVAVAAARLLAEAGIAVRLDIVGEGPELAEVGALPTVPGLEIVVHGWLDEAALGARYAHAHVLVLPSRSEGFPKVAAEAMAHGAVPVVTAVGAVASVFARVGAGRAVEHLQARAFADVIGELVEDPAAWAAASAACTDAATAFTYETYLGAVAPLLRPGHGDEGGHH